MKNEDNLKEYLAKLRDTFSAEVEVLLSLPWSEEDYKFLIEGITENVRAVLDKVENAVTKIKDGIIESEEQKAEDKASSETAGI